MIQRTHINADCIFCKIGGHEIASDKVYEDTEVYAFADINPVNLGHTLVIPKTHYKNLYETPDELLSKMIVVAKKIAAAAREALVADGVNIEMNNDAAAGQIIFHSHLHVVPRFEGDGYLHWKGPARRPTEIAEAAERLRAAVEQS